jgi:hypothetical protein
MDKQTIILFIVLVVLIIVGLYFLIKNKIIKPTPHPSPQPNTPQPNTQSNTQPTPQPNTQSNTHSNTQPNTKPNTQPTKNIYKGYIDEDDSDNCVGYKNGDNNKECVKFDCNQGDNECHCLVRCMNDKGENNYIYSKCSGYIASEFNPDSLCLNFNNSKAFPFEL